MSGILLFGSFAVLLVLGVPICVSLGLSSVVGLLASGFDLGMLPDTIYASVCKYALLAVPFFVLAGAIMEYAGISEKLIRFADTCVGHRKSGLITVVVVTSCFFAAISGSGAAAVAALGGILIPAMADAKYDKGISTVLVSASGAIGIIIPPSIGYVVYASIVNVSVSDLFLAGIIPGILLGISYIVVAVWMSRGNHEIIHRGPASGKERWAAFKDAIWGLLMPVIILGGIYGSIFTPTEAAAVSVFYGLIVGVFIYREVNWKKMKDILIDSCSTTATVMFITMGATLFGYVLTRARLDLAIENFMLTVTNGNTVIFFIIVNVVLLIAGCFLDSTSALYIFTPLFAPVAVQLGIDPIHLGTVMIVNLAIGLFTPPVGVNLYVACGIGDIKIEEITKGIVPCLIAELAVLLLITYVPAISTFLIH